MLWWLSKLHRLALIFSKILLHALFRLSFYFCQLGSSSWVYVGSITSLWRFFFFSYPYVACLSVVCVSILSNSIICVLCCSHVYAGRGLCKSPSQSPLLIELCAGLLGLLSESFVFFFCLIVCLSPCSCVSWFLLFFVAVYVCFMSDRVLCLHQSLSPCMCMFVCIYSFYVCCVFLSVKVLICR